MKIDLPLETWVDIFHFSPRHQLVQLVPHIGERRKRNRRGRFCRTTINDRQFVSFIQYFLHRCANIKLAKLWIRPPKRRNGHPFILVHNKGRPFRELPLPDIPILKNITDFKEILISCFDQSVLAFLRQFQHNSLLENVNITIYNSDQGKLLALMADLLPLITSINSLDVVTNMLRLFQNENEFSQLAQPILASTRKLFGSYDLIHDEWFCNWLYTHRADGKPRILLLSLKKQMRENFYRFFLGRIKKDFMDSNVAISYFINILFMDVGFGNFQPVILENYRTNEKLVITKVHIYLEISRYPIGSRKEWIKEMLKFSSMKTRKIIINI